MSRRRAYRHIEAELEEEESPWESFLRNTV
jgi:hypothetical protein